MVVVNDENQAAGLEAEAAALEGEHIQAGDTRSAPETEPAGPETGEVLAQLYFPVFKLFFPAWEISPKECELLGAAHGAVIDKYFPDFDLGVELNAVLITAMVFGARIGRPTRRAEDVAKERWKGTDQPPEGATDGAPPNG